MPMDPDDIFALGEEAPNIPVIDANPNPVQEEENGGVGMPMDHDDIFGPEEEVSNIPFIDANPVQEEESGVDFESDNPAVLQIPEGHVVARSDRRPGKGPGWLGKAFFPFSLCLIGMSAFLILYLILR